MPTVAITPVQLIARPSLTVWFVCVYTLLRRSSMVRGVTSEASAYKRGASKVVPSRAHSTASAERGEQLCDAAGG